MAPNTPPAVEELPRPPFHYHLVLVEPEIPPNTGNIGRLCVAIQGTLHLVHPLGFDISDKAVRRAGLDYWKFVDLIEHQSFEAFLQWFEEHEPGAPYFLLSKKAQKSIYSLKLPARAAFVFGKETLGLPEALLEKHAERSFTIPMFSSRIRSLNLSNAVSLTVYEAIRQHL
ncbi:MAG: tRNA (cytidine(34)-2'-O)-methyltransferase [Deltaproteobacteria bacterium]|nr:tRNA (cytidine(34)-2'-O)-methyltransferase [Deltaproteobacteria bacterium]